MFIGNRGDGETRSCAEDSPGTTWVRARSLEFKGLHPSNPF